MQMIAMLAYTFVRAGVKIDRFSIPVIRGSQSIFMLIFMCRLTSL